MGTSLALPSALCSLKAYAGIEKPALKRGSRVFQGCAPQAKQFPQLLAVTCLQLGLGSPPGLALGPVSCQVTAYAGLRKYAFFLCNLAVKMKNL